MDDWRGFSLPQDSTGELALYGPPPWHFEGVSASIFLSYDSQRAAALVPPPLKLFGDPVARLSVHDLVCDYGLGEEFVQRNPDIALLGEAVVGFLVEHDGVVGQWCPYLWCTTDAEFAVGREFYGWSQQIGEMCLTRKPFRGWRSGDAISGLVSRGNRAVFELEISLDNTGEDPREMFPTQSTANHHYTQTALPDPVEPEIIRRRLYRTAMQDVEISDTWFGTGQVQIAAPELEFLVDSVPLGGRWSTISWTKPYPDQLVHEEKAEA